MGESKEEGLATMADAAGDHRDEPRPTPSPTASAESSPLLAYRAALGRYQGVCLHEIHQALGAPRPEARPQALPGVIADRLEGPQVAGRLLASLGDPARITLSLFALTENPTWPVLGLAHALTALGVEPIPVLHSLVAHGLLAIRADSQAEPLGDLDRLLGTEAPGDALLLAHPSAIAAARTVLPVGDRLPAAGPVRQVRQADGLEPILRLSVVWQRLDEAPLRQTQQGTLFKRDRERLEDDPILAGPIADAIEPLPDMAPFWLALALGVGLVEPEPSSDRIVAARPEFWAENAVHLPQMIATRWMGLRTWHEQGGMRLEGGTVELALPYIRPVILLWLATLAEPDWVALDDLAAHLQSLNPDWARATFLAEGPAPLSIHPQIEGKAGRLVPPSDLAAIESILLGPAYQLGLVRAAEEVIGGRRVVQLTPLGRYVLTIGPPPEPRPGFDHFLFVQPNFEIIAYRQGLTPALIGLFSRLARWSQIGAALEMKLTPETVYRALEGGLTPEAILERLALHSSRPLPAGVAETLRTWAGRRDRVSYHAAATLIEFTSRDDLEAALRLWPASCRVAPVVVSDRLLLVEDESSIPFARFRLAGSRDYRRPAEACLEVEPDGVTLSLDLGRSDLLVDAELARFADEQPIEPARGSLGTPRRRFLVSPASLARAIDNGQSFDFFARWYPQRTGAGIPPAVRLLLHAAQGSPGSPLSTSRPLLLHAPSSDVIDGLLQHPETRAHLGERLGPTVVIVPHGALSSLQAALATLGLSIDEPRPDRREADDPPPPKPDPARRAKRR